MAASCFIEFPENFGGVRWQDRWHHVALCWDTQPPERWIANELRRDSSNIFNGGDSMTLVLDTLFDQRNGFLFQTNPLGGIKLRVEHGGLFEDLPRTADGTAANDFNGIDAW